MTQTVTLKNISSNTVGVPVSKFVFQPLLSLASGEFSLNTDIQQMIDAGVLLQTFPAIPGSVELLNIQDEGLDVGIATTLNVIGGNATIGVTDEVASLIITGSGGGGGAGTLIFQDEGVSQGAAATLNVVGAGASVSVSGGAGTLTVPGLAVFDEGVSKGNAASMNVVGGGASIVVSSGASTLTVPGLVYTIFLSPSGGNDSPAINAAYTTLANAGGGILRLDRGTFLLNTGVSGSRVCINLQQNHVGFVTIQGSGKGATKLKFGTGSGTSCTCFIAFNSGSGAGTMYQNLNLEDFTLDNNFLTTSSSDNNVGALITCAGAQNVQDINVKRIDILNMNLPVGFPWRSGIQIECYQEGEGTDGNPYGGTAYIIQRILAEDFRCFGGNYGIQIAGYYAYSSTPALEPRKTGCMSPAGFDQWQLNVQLNDITFNRCFWDSGGMAPSGQSQPTSGFIIGQNGHGTRWRLYDCYASRSWDDNFELDSCDDLHLHNCTGDSGNFESFFFSNLGGLPSSVVQQTRVTGCKNLTTYYVPGVTVSPRGLFVSSNNGTGTPYGSFKLEDYVGGATFDGDVREITVNGMVVQGSQPQRTLTSTGNSSAFSTGGALTFALQGGHSNISVSNLDVKDNAQINYAGFSSNTVSSTTIDIKCFTSANINISGVRINNNVDKVPGSTGSGTFTWWPIQLYSSVNGSSSFGNKQIDPFTTNTFTISYISDTNTYFDMAVSGGKLTCIANPTTEKRQTWISYYPGTSNATTGPFLDTAIWITSTPTTITGHKTGIVLKRQDTRNGGSGYYLECWLTDDGVNTILNIDKIVNGVRTNLATTNSGTRITSSTTYYLMGRIIGNVVSLYYKSVEPFSALDITNNLITSLSYTLSGYSEVSRFGLNSMGWGGFSWIPMDTSATLDNLTRDGLMVLEGKGISDVTMKCIDNVNVTEILHYTDPTNAAKWVRYNNTFNFSDFNLVAVSSSSSQVDTTASLPAAYLQTIRRSGKWLVNPAPAAITVTASPFTYTNSDGYNEDVTVYGGTVSLIEMSRDAGTTFTTVNSTTGYKDMLNPSDQIRVTYSVAPTMNKINRMLG